MRASVLLALVTLAGCATTAPPDRAPADVEALAAQCPELTAASGVALVSIRAVGARIPEASLSGRYASWNTPDSFVEAAERADAVWAYDASSDVGGMRTGDAGMMAIRGCEVVARQTYIIYN